MVAILSVFYWRFLRFVGFGLFGLIIRREWSMIGRLPFMIWFSVSFGTCAPWSRGSTSSIFNSLSRILPLSFHLLLKVLAVLCSKTSTPWDILWHLSTWFHPYCQTCLYWPPSHSKPMSPITQKPKVSSHHPPLNTFSPTLLIRSNKSMEFDHNCPRSLSYTRMGNPLPWMGESRCTFHRSSIQ